ncbi:tetrahydromethanopterin S-methyltransferase subunit F [Methanospirillum sp.]|uniref:tetrahydromethanopterin S-methyltransferase subunit F n=1 Tax=Methanospirillum sp. TaxID=45200 RepID=UPI00298755B1|nr:tetrahydromethanopterin S-methyltransferase subunit F [Methanospirillum sp.]
MSDEKKSGPIRMAAIDAMMVDMKYKGQILARTNKLESGIMGSGIVGFAIGLVFALILVVPVILLGGF